MNKKYNYRSLSLRLSEDGKPSSLIEEARSVEVVAATETPVEVYDYERWELVPEILLMAGCQLPESRQVPLLDTHKRYDTASVIGSCRGLGFEDSQLIGRCNFSEVAEAEGPWTKMREGHLTDVSIGYRILESVWIEDKTTATVEGREYSGPLRVVTRWLPKELSVCPIGADELAKARADAQPENKEMHMDPKTRAFLERRGLPKDATEEEAIAFLEKLDVKRQDPPAGATAQELDLDQARKEATEAEQARSTEITAMGTRFDCADLATTLVNDGKTVDQARQKIMDHIDKQQDKADDLPFRSISVGIEEKDKFRTAGTDSLLIRAGIAPDKPAAGSTDLAGFALRELARHSLVLAGQPIGGNVMEMVGRAMTTSEFPLLLANAANKSLNIGWETSEETWPQWCGTGQVSDFKTHTRPRASEVDDLDEIPEGTPYKYGDRSEAQESYSIVTYGKKFAITRQAIINDDLSALSDIPQQHGESAARKIGDVAYAVLTANAAMGDGTALFASGHSNLGTGGVLSETTTAEAIKLMKLQKDIKDKRRLNIRAQFFLAPVALEGSTELFFANQYLDVTSGSAQTNPYSGKRFERVYDARLDDSSATAYYFTGPKGKTVVVFFLNGVQKPYMETRDGWSVDGVEYKVRIDCGAKALDWRGMVKNAGA